MAIIFFSLILFVAFLKIFSSMRPSNLGIPLMKNSDIPGTDLVEFIRSCELGSL